MEVPHKLFEISTKYFDIIFTEQSKNTAVYLAENADNLYEKAMEYLNIKETFRIPVVISPDSEELKISYSPIPYNRIILYDGVPSEHQTNYENVLLTLFYHEVLLAVNESYRSPFAQVINKVIDVDSFQPVALWNLPYSFLHGFANVIDGKVDDRAFLQILSQAKIEGKFPTWFQVSANRDIDPGRDLALAAGTAFTAFIQQRWGMEKYIELWNECGKLQITLMPLTFYKVYGIRIEEMWKEFEDSIPGIEDLRVYENQDSFLTQLFNNDTESRYTNILATEYGFIWYDSIRHEVDIYDQYIPIKIRQLLFLADSVERLSLSPDGRFMTVTYNGYQNRSNFSKKMTRIFDIKRRCFVSSTFELRDAAIVILPDGNYGIAGIKVKNATPVLQVYTAGDLSSILQLEGVNNNEKKHAELIFEQNFDFGDIPFSPVYAGKGKINYILKSGNNWKFYQLDMSTNKEKCWLLSDIVPSNLSYTKKYQNKNFSSKQNDDIYTFEYFPVDSKGFTRMGYIEINKDYEPVSIYLQNCEFVGGVHSPVIRNSEVYFSSRKLNYDSFVSCPLYKMELVRKEVIEINEQVITQNKENSYDLYKKYNFNPFKYYGFGTLYPFFPVKTIDLEDGVKLWPGLGITYENETDPFDNTQIILSASYALAKLDYSTLKNPSTDEILEMEGQSIGLNTDYSFAGYVKNTSLPADIVLASTFQFRKSGFYDFRWLAGTGINIPLGMTFQNLRLSLQSENAFSTKYYDKLQEGVYPDKPGWTKLSSCYSFLECSFIAEYTNYNQYGISPFEMRGLKVKNKLYYFWDYEKKEGTHLNSSLYATIGIPRLTPFQMYNGWIFSVPATVNAEFMGKNGTALEACTELLLIGREIQNGLPFLYLYFNRFGLKAGYDLCLNYDTNIISLPDIREIARFQNIFANTHTFDNFYLKFDLDFVPPIGRLSSAKLKSETILSYYIRTKVYKFTINLDIEM